jgi:hypothetical protein
VIVSGPGGKDTIVREARAVVYGIRPGVHRVVALAESGVRGAAIVTCPPGETVDVSIAMQPLDPSTGSVLGRIVESTSKEPIAGCTISVRGQSVSTRSIDNGSFVLERVGTGRTVIIDAVTPRGDTLIAFTSVKQGGISSVEFSTQQAITAGVETGVVAAYPFDAASSAATQALVDMGPRAQHGEMHDVAPSQNRHGLANKAARFNGTSYAEVPHSSAQALLPMTVSFFIRVDPKTERTCFILGKYLHPSGEGWTVFLESGLLCAGYFRNGFGNWTRVNTATDITNSAWRHVVVAVDAVGLTLYVDGARTPAVAFNGAPTATTSSEPLRFGRLRSTSWPTMPGFVGELDDVVIYDRVLSESEIVKLRENK